MMKKRESFIEATGNSPRNSSNDKLEKLLGIHERSLVMGKRNFKILLLGEGKSAFIGRMFREAEFGGCDIYDPTIEDMYTEELEMKGIRYTLEICDLGNEMYNLKNEKWIKWADGFLIIYLVDSKRSLELAVKRREDIAKLLANKYVPTIFVASKIDCPSRAVTPSQGKEKADYFRSTYLEASAATGENVHTCWETLLDELVKIEEANKAQSGRKSGWLKKKRNKGWKKRWFVLFETALRYYEKKDHTSPKGAISLSGCQMVADPSEELNLMKKDIKKESGHIIVLIIDKADTYYLACENEMDKFEWREALNDAINAAKMKIDGVEKRNYSFIGFDAKRGTMEKSKREAFRSKFLASSRSSMISEVEASIPDSSTEKEIVKQNTPQQNAKLFNESPKKTIKKLLESGLYSKPEEIANFLYSESTLKKSKIGEYLGENDEFALSVLKAYTNLFSLKETTFDTALRNFLSKFRLPGEAQKIDRIMEHFAKKYVQDNEGSFGSEDTAYVLAFSLIMLNTDSHNPAVQRKMTKDQFISNNRGIDNGKDLPSEFLGNLYDSIVQNEIEMDFERDDLMNCDCKGWIDWNSGKNGKSFTKVYAIVSSSCMYLFNKPDDSSPAYIILLSNLAVETKPISMDTFTLINPKGKVRAAKGGSEKYFDSISFSVENWRKRFEWMRAIRMNSASSSLTY